MNPKSKNAITINARLLQGATLDKLADGRLMIRNGKTAKSSSEYSPPGRIKCATEPGLFVRLNTTTYDHAFGVVTKREKDKATGEVTGGKEHIIGKFSDFQTETVGGRRKYDLDRVISTCRDWYRNGKSGATNVSSDGITLDECFVIWSKKKIRGNKTRKPSHVAQVRRCLDVFAGDWLDRTISDISDNEIEDRAEAISNGEHESPVSRREVGSYAEARRWLLSMSAIHNATKRKHKSFNEFEAILEDYPQDDGKQRALTRDEITAVLGFEKTRCLAYKGLPREGDIDPWLWLRMLALKFQLLSGYRISEVIALRDRDIVRDDPDCPHIVSGDDPEYFERKSRRAHWLPLTPQLEAILDEAHETRESCESMSGSDFVFCNRDGERYTSGAASFKPARKLLEALKLVKEEKVPGNGKRLIVSHDCRRTFETYGEHDAGVDLETLGALLDHSDSKLAKQVYSLPTHEQRMTKLATVRESHTAICAALEDIACGDSRHA